MVIVRPDHETAVERLNDRAGCASEQFRSDREVAGLGDFAGFRWRPYAAERYRNPGDLFDRLGQAINGNGHLSAELPLGSRDDEELLSIACNFAVLCPGLEQNGNIGVRILPEREKICIGGFGLLRISLHAPGASKL